MVAPARLTLVEPDAAVTVPPVHEFVRPFGFATASPAGNASVKPTLVSGMVLIAGLAIVNVRLVLPPTGIAGAPKAFVMVGGAMTVMLADAVAPVPPSVEVTAPVVLFWGPATVPLTVTLKVQDIPPPRVPFARLMLLPPGLAVIVPVPHVPFTPPGATINPAGSVSLKATPLND